MTKLQKAIVHAQDIQGDKTPKCIEIKHMGNKTFMVTLISDMLCGNYDTVEMSDIELLYLRDSLIEMCDSHNLKGES